MIERAIRICLPIEGTFDAVYGGGQVYVRNIAHALCRMGHEVSVLECVLFPSGNAENRLQNERYDGNGIRLLTLHLSPGCGWDRQEQVEAVVREGIVRAAPDIVHANGMKSLFSRVCAAMNIPCIVTAHHGGLVCPAGTLLDYKDRICRRSVDQEECTRCCVRLQPLGVLWTILIAVMPVCVQFWVGRLLRRIPLIPYVTPALTIPLQVQEKLLEVAEIFSKARCVIAPSKAMQTALLLNGARRESTVLARHGIPALVSVKLQVTSGRHVVRFAYIGRLNRVKGLHVLVQAFNRLSGDAELHIIGNAKTKNEKRYWASVLKQVTRAERVIQHGYLVDADYRNVVGECDVVILPSICLEVFGLSIAEAFSLGRPVIATDSGGPTEQIRNGLDGVIVQPNDVAALAEAMQGFLDDPTKARTLAENVREPITIESHVEALSGLYSQCMSQIDSV